MKNNVFFVRTLQYLDQPFVPKEATLENTPRGTPANWLQPLGRIAKPMGIALSVIAASGMVLPPQPPPAAAYTPSLEFQAPTWKATPRMVRAPAGGSPFVPAEAVVDNTPVGTPASWQVRWQLPPRNAQPLAAGVVFAQPPVVPEVVVASTRTAMPSRRTLFYQSTVEVYPPAAFDNTVTIDKWQQPLSQAVPRRPVFAGLYHPFVPKEATVDNTPAGAGFELTLDGWGRFPRTTLNLGGSPFIPKEAVLENTATPDKWLQPFYEAVPPKRPIHTEPFFGYPYIAQSNLTTTLEWLVAWKGPPRPWPLGKPYQPFVPKEAVLENTITGGGWDLTTDGRQGPPRQLLGLPGGSPFVPRAAVLDNTITPDNWQRPFDKAVPTPPVHHTEPFFGYPYAAASNLTTTLEWMVGWQGPPRYWPPGKPYQPFVPKEATLENTITGSGFDLTTDGRQGPPRQLLGLPSGAPFVARAAVLDNTITPDNWLQRFQGPPRYKPVHTQPFYGYPYASADNTVTPDKWLLGFQKAVPTHPPQTTQPFYGYPYVSQVNLTTTLEWQLAWRGPPRALLPLGTASGETWVPPVPPEEYSVFGAEAPALFSRTLHVTEPPFIPKEATVENTVTPDKWMMRWQGPPRYWPLGKPYQPFVPREVVAENTVTPDKWLLGFRKAVPHGWPTHTQPFYGYPYVVQANLTTTLEWMVAWQGPPRIWPLGKPYQPFVPREATVENRTTTLDWLQRFNRAAPIPHPAQSQPIFPYPVINNLTTTLEWLVKWDRMPRFWPPIGSRPSQPFVPRAATVENTVTPDKWLFRFTKAVPNVNPPEPTQPFYGYPYEGVVQFIPVCAHTELVFPTAVISVIFHTTDTEVLFPTGNTEPEECPD